MMTIYKVLEILNSDDYVKIEEHHESSNYCPYSESSYTVTLKEGGMIRITQVDSFGIFYRIKLFVPNESKSIEGWTFRIQKQKKRGLLSFQTIKDPLYDEVSLAFYHLHHSYSMKKMEEHSKYFPQ